jgi:membrane associated rhomboid family serine protease
MPLPPPPPRTGAAAETYQSAVREFQVKAILFSAATVAMVVVWLLVARDMQFHTVWVLIAAVGAQAVKNIRRWQELRRTNPRGFLHPDRVAAQERDTVQVMSDAVKSRAWMTRGIIVCIAVPTLLEVVVGVDRAVAVASVDTFAVRAGEWWRLLGGTYLHGSPMHFLGNASVLLVYGAILESKTSRLRLPLVYLLSCLGGSLCSVLLPPDVPSVGASGGIVGVIAYLFVFSRRQSVRFPAAFHGATASVLGGLVVAGVIGISYIDNAGHLGGALTGMALAALIVDPATYFGDELPLPIMDGLGAVAAIVLMVGSVVTCVALLR